MRQKRACSVILACIAILSLPGAILAAPPEPAPISDLFYVECYEPDGVLSIIIPADTGSWNPSIGLAGAWTFWTGKNIGWAPRLGLEYWTIKDGAFEVDAAKNISVFLDGGAYVFPLGVLFRYSFPWTERWHADISAGLEYLFIVPTAVVHFKYKNHWKRWRDDQGCLSFDDRFAIAGDFDAVYAWNENLNFKIGLGCRIDLNTADNNFLAENVGNDFSAVMLKAGMSWRF